MSAVLERTKPMQRAALKPKRCKSKACGCTFTPSRQLQAVCSPLCAEDIARAKREQQEAKDRRQAARDAREDRAETRRKLEAIKTLPALKKEAEQAMNAWVRWRDRAMGCISCQAPFPAGSAGGDFDAGHFRSKGSSPHLRFDERNVHGQCKHCNHRLTGNPIGYERGLAARIGSAAVEALKSDQEPRRHTRDDCRRIRDDFRARLRAAKKEG